MKRLNIIYLFLAMTIVLGSCSSSNSVVSNRLITKRKYNKGFHVKKKGNYKSSNEDVAKNKDVEKVDRKKFSDRTKSSNKQQEVVVAESSESAPLNWSAEESDLNERTTSTRSSDRVNSDEVTEDKPVSAEKRDASIEEEQEEKDSRNSLKKKAKKSESSGWGADAIFILAVICAILIPPLGVGIYTNIDWMKVLIALLLTILFWLPGMIYALLVVFDVI